MSTNIANGQTVRAETNRGIITGEVTGINNRKVTIQADSRVIEEAGSKMKLEIDETVTIMDYKIETIVES